MNAYGQPFPNVVVNDAAPVWSENDHPHLQSLETRLARHAHRHRGCEQGHHPAALSIMNASLVLSTGAIGQMITQTFV